MITVDEISAKATAYFNALYTNNEAKSVSINATYTASSGQGSTILVNGIAIVTDFMRVAGFPNHRFQHQFDLRLGQCAHAGRDGARRHRIDGQRRQDGRVEARRQA